MCSLIVDKGTWKVGQIKSFRTMSGKSTAGALASNPCNCFSTISCCKCQEKAHHSVGRSASAAVVLFFFAMRKAKDPGGCAQPNPAWCSELYVAHWDLDSIHCL